MCLIVLAHRQHSGYPLIVVANRDEFHQREAAPAHWWHEPDTVLAGTDLQAGGTWMGVNRSGNWAAVTNYREGEQASSPRSRGELPLGFLQGDQAPVDYLDTVAGRSDHYSGFSLLAGNDKELWYYANRGRQRPMAVTPGIHTLSNHLLDTPWPKAELARLKLAQALRNDKPQVEALLAVLSDDQPFEDHELPATGVSRELERTLSPPFIVGEQYGTRCTTVLMVSADGLCCFAEQVFLPGGKKGAFALFEFELAP